MMIPSEIAKEAKEIILERGWNKRLLEGPGGEVCLTGAVLLVLTGTYTGENLVDEALKDYINFSGLVRQITKKTDIWKFNDDTNTELADVLSLLDEIA